MSVLLQCPFCGESAIVKTVLAYRPGFVQIRCSNDLCLLHDEREGNFYETEPEAAEKWNRRQPQEQAYRPLSYDTK